MTRVDFYILPQSDNAARWHFTCRLVDKALRQGNCLLIHTGSHADALTLDNLLWSAMPESFLPHDVLPAGKQTPVHIGWGEDSAHHHHLLINLGPEIPAFFSRFERVIEVVTQDPASLAESRERYRFYRERGYPLDTLRIGGSTQTPAAAAT